MNRIGLYRAVAPFVVLIALLALPMNVHADDHPFVAPIFTDNMVLQVDQKDAIWGWASPGTVVTVTTDSRQAVTATAGADGKWTAWLDIRKAGGPHTIDVSAPPQSARFVNVLFGDVWICSGQSNMQFGITLGNEASKEVAAADHPDIRLSIVPMTISPAPVDVAPSPWAVCTPQTIVSLGGWGGFSAVAYYFGRDLERRLHVPIGLIETCWGGTPAEAWTSDDALRGVPDFGNPQTTFTGTKQNAPSVLFNAMINPLIPYGIKGAIWYQGESNADRAAQYRTLLPTMIGDWRKRWSDGDFPFLIVQLAGYGTSEPDPVDDQWADLREAQAMTATSIPNAGLAVAIDVGNARDIHPHNKQEVGRRLSLVALRQVYHKRVDDPGPVLKNASTTSTSIAVKFDHARGLHLVGDAGRCFAVSGADRHFVWATAIVKGDTVTVTAPQVTNPQFVRYDWSNTPVCSLYNRDGLPAVPFRTDSGNDGPARQ